MNGHYDYSVQLLTFRNIDLPLQGVYFLQFKLGSVPQRSMAMSYNAAAHESHANKLHNLFPPQISIDDALQSTGFVIQFSDEEVGLTDSFRISLRDAIHFYPDDSGRVALRKTSGFLQDPIVLSVDLLFSNATDVGGLDQILRAPDKADFPTEFAVVASQCIVLGQGCETQYFRIPLALLREYDSEQAEAEDKASGDIFPCAFLEGLILSSLLKIDVPFGWDTGCLLTTSRELEASPSAIQEALLRELNSVSRYHERLLTDLEVPLLTSLRSKEFNFKEDQAFISEIERISGRLFLTWSHIMGGFLKKLIKGRLKLDWRNRLIETARFYLKSPSGVRIRDWRLWTGMEYFLYGLEKAKVPILQADNVSPEPCQIRSHGSHLIVLVHGYKGTVNDVRVIRNTIACLCPDVQVLSSSANEDQTDGDIESMGMRLSMEIGEFLTKHATSFFIINRISFVAHSLGGLIVRAALPLLSEYKERFHMYISLSTPHLGISNTLLESAIFFLQLFKRSEVLDQLTMRDSPSPNDCFITKLCHMQGLDWFRRVLLVGSSQDQYAPLFSATVDPGIDDDHVVNIARRLLAPLSRTKLVRVDVKFDMSEVPNLDNVIGRAAHIKFLESSVLIQLLFLINSDMIDI